MVHISSYTRILNITYMTTHNNSKYNLHKHTRTNIYIYIYSVCSKSIMTQSLNFLNFRISNSKCKWQFVHSWVTYIIKFGLRRHTVNNACQFLTYAFIRLTLGLMNAWVINWLTVVKHHWFCVYTILTYIYIYIIIFILINYFKSIAD